MEIEKYQREELFEEEEQVFLRARAEYPIPEELPKAARFYEAVAGDFFRFCRKKLFPAAKKAALEAKKERRFFKLWEAVMSFSSKEEESKALRVSYSWLIKRGAKKSARRYEDVWPADRQSSEDDEQNV